MKSPSGRSTPTLITTILSLTLLCLSAIKPALADELLPGKVSDWHSFARHDFKLGDRACIIVAPASPADGKPWIWRARFFGHEPQADIEMLRRGYHIAYCEVGNLFGNPEAVEHWNRFHEFLTTKHGFAKKVALEGMSRGGLIIYNWAAANPEKVACLYGDAPVCDFKSWPGGKGKGKGSAGSWQACLKAYGLTEEQALKYDRNPIDQLKPLAEANIPILHVVGDADDVVPVEENSAIIEARYKALGGSIQVISKPGVGHHPHALKDPAPIVEFFLKHTAAR